MDLKKGSGVEVQMMEFERAVVSDSSGALVIKTAETKNDASGDKVFDSKNREIKVDGLNTYSSKVNLNAVTDVSSFQKLNHYDQLLFVRQSSNKDLLSDIAKESPKKQIQNEARKRVETL